MERLFSLGKDILKPKRCGLSDEHFKILAFLKGNQLISVFKIFVNYQCIFLDQASRGGVLEDVLGLEDVLEDRF